MLGAETPNKANYNYLYSLWSLYSNRIEIGVRALNASHVTLNCNLENIDWLCYFTNASNTN